MVLDLVQNVALLVALAVALQLAAQRLRGRPVLLSAARGLLFGGVGVVGMMTPVHFAPGVIYDGRSIVLSLAGLFGGPVTAAAAAALCAAYRLHLGGPGAAVGVLVVVEAAALGTALYYLRQRDEAWVGPFRLWGFGVLVHAGMMGLQLFLPGPTGWDVLRRIGPAVLALYPLGFLLIAQVFLDGERRLRAQQELRDSEARYRAIAEDMPVMICRLRPGSEIAYANEACCRWFRRGRGEIVGSSFLRMIPPEFREAVREDLSRLTPGSPIVTHEHPVIGPGGDTRWHRWTHRLLCDPGGRVSGYQGIGEDVTDRRAAEEKSARLENRLRQAEKMQAIGTLAGGIAHDFNNILGIILGNTEMALSALPGPHPARSHLREVKTATLRARDTVGRILAFTRSSELKVRPVRLSPIVRETLGMLRATLPSTIAFRESLEAGADTVLADPAQISRVLINLCTNAHQAMREAGGVLTVRLTERTVPEEEGSPPAEPAPGDYLLLEVSDTGPGMEPHVARRIFDPYFTTKDVGQGTGMGLSVVHGIVRDHGGSVRVESAPGRGTCVQVFFPSHGGEVQAEREPELPAARGAERILWVDDEEALADVGRLMLEHLGYRVTTQTSAPQALALFREAPDRFDLVVTDMTMPRLTGVDLARELRRVRPELPVILCTGFSEGLSQEQAARMGIQAVLIKPVGLREISETVRKVLAPGSGGTFPSE